MSRVGNLPSPLHRGEKNDEMTRLKQFLLPVVVAIGFGPLMAGLGVSLVAIATSLLDPAKTLRITESWPMFGVYIGFAYLVGAPIALMAGILVSVWMIWRPPSLMVAIAAAIVATSCYAAVAALGVLGPVEQTNARSNFLFTIVIAAIAAAACWLLIRRFADNFPRQVRELKQAPRTIARPKTIVFQNCNNNR